TMPAADLIAHLHPHDQPSREHTLAAVAQIRELARYLATVTDHPQDVSKALPAPNVVSDVCLILRDAMPNLAELFQALGARTEQFADSPRLYSYAEDDGDAPPGSAAHYVTQAATKLLAVASTVNTLRTTLDTAGEAGTMFNLRTGA
ncbi:hypothetical protein AB0D32_31215, partial [Micromonospora sp. NPDC048170]